MSPSKYSVGIPLDIAGELFQHHAPRSISKVYNFLYNHSGYHIPKSNPTIEGTPPKGYRMSEFTVVRISRTTKLGERTVVRALAYLRHHRYILRIWRGYPEPTDPRYNHSAYELPYNLLHVTAWRIHQGRPPVIHNMSKSGFS